MSARAKRTFSFVQVRANALRLKYRLQRNRCWAATVSFLWRLRFLQNQVGQASQARRMPLPQPAARSNDDGSSMARANCPYALGFRSLDREVAGLTLPVTGRLPDWLSGSLFRTGPAKFEIGRQSYAHWFDGLAMLHGFHFKGDTVSYSNRFVRSH